MIGYDPVDRGFGEFFIYASRHWLQHFPAITAEPLPSLASIEELCRPGSTLLDNWVQQYRRPDCVITARYFFDPNQYDALCITSIYGSEAMIHSVLKNSSFDKDKFFPETVLKAADEVLVWGGRYSEWCSVSRVKTLFLDGKFGHQLQNLEFFRLVIK